MINELELIQLVLDRAATAEEAVSIIADANVRAMSRIQYFVTDATGVTVAVLPTLDGLIVNIDENMPVRALTNTGYQDLLDQLSRFTGFGGTSPLPFRTIKPNPDSVERFALAASASKNHEPVAVSDGFAALEAVENPDTRWQIVVQPSDGVIAFSVAGSAQQWRIDMGEIDYSCLPGPPAQSLNDLPVSETGVQFQPLENHRWAGTLFEVLTGFSDTIGLPPELAWPITDAQIASITCAE
ncbi:hypothetical protein [Ruegeria atlantica]|uniref:hypothetical protein n=1 Tax=Ruegeria atlantica TaxID=81569 RepID=UPI00147DC21D|nr:hypothetical protein [Ruegeria atlantica]